MLLSRKYKFIIIQDSIIYSDLFFFLFFLDSITVPSSVANETLAVTVGIDTGFGNVTIQKLTGNDSAQEFILQDASDVFNYFGVNV